MIYIQEETQVGRYLAAAAWNKLSRRTICSGFCLDPPTREEVDRLEGLQGLAWACIGLASN